MEGEIFLFDLVKKYRTEIIFLIFSAVVLSGGFYLGVISHSVRVVKSVPVDLKDDLLKEATTVTETYTSTTVVNTTETTSETATVVQVDDTPGVIVVPNLVPADSEEEIEFTTRERKEVPSEGICAVSVNISTIDGKADIKSISEEYGADEGELFGNEEAEIREGDTAFSLLERELILKGILIEYNKTNGIVITDIGNIGEGDFGELSGWKYKVNGEFPDVDCDKYVVEPGDVIEWVYTCDGGNDIGYEEKVTEESTYSETTSEAESVEE